MIKEIKQSELLKKLPESWDDVTLDFYTKNLLKLEEKNIESLEDMYEDYIHIASLYTEIPAEMIRKMPMVTVQLIYDRLSFLSQKPLKKEKSKYRWIKKIQDPDYDTFIFYLRAIEVMAGGNFEIMVELIEKICLDKISREEIRNMSMSEVETGFFLLRKHLRRYSISSHNSLLRKAILMEAKEKTKNLLSRMTLKNGKAK
jgi:hypothetical protein